MEPVVFAAVLLAALLHASWNALVKFSADKHLGMSAVVLGHVPASAVALLLFPWPEPASWPYLAGGVLLHTGYQFFLLNSYRIGDLTQVYPIARGAAPMIVACVSVLILGVTLSGLETLAVFLIGAGIMSLVLVRGSDGMLNARAAAMALATGCFIAGYSLVDGLGARVAGTAVGFYGWLSILNAVLFAAILQITRPGLLARLIPDAARPALVGGTASFLAYALVIWAFTQAPIALVTALRETSIIFALLIGVFFLREKLNLVKLAATIVTLSGAILLRYGRG